MPHTPKLRPASSTLKRSLRRSTAGGRAVIGALVVCILGASGCDRIRDTLRPPGGGGDPRWTGDSTLLASKPEILFRVRRLNGNERIVPIATLGSHGFRPLYFSSRGWRAFDLEYLQKGSRLTTYRAGHASGSAEMLRGMWEPPSAPLDTHSTCGSVVPVAKAVMGNGVTLLTSGTRPPLKPVRALAASELQAALGTVPTLIAPASGISGARLLKFKREVYVVNSATSSSPTIVIVYNDPALLADSVAPIAERPRHLVVVLDRGVYGYRPTFTYASAGNRKSLPRYHFIDYLDVDDDGRAELFFGMTDPRVPPLYTVVLRFENEAWRELLRYDGNPCQS